MLIHKITNDKPSPVSCGGLRSEEDGTLTPIMMTLEAMPDVVLEVMTVIILYHKRLNYSQEKCRNMEDG